jgi:N-acetylglucosamine kinase-like BadF-type ATPase
VDEGSGSVIRQCLTSGINPFYQDKKTIFSLLEREFAIPLEDRVNLYFYGAGCSGDTARAIVYEPLKAFFNPVHLWVESDLMAAAHSLCQHSEGIACILGTGSNSCYYNGQVIAQQIPSLGYILGDEGSGADIGRRLVSDILKKQLPPGITEKFLSTYSLSPEKILEHVYKNPFPNRFLARFAIFVSENIEEPALHTLVRTGFNKFFTRNIRHYARAQDHPVHFTGSIAFNFKDILQESAAANGFHVGMITLNPMPGLIKFHTT